MIYGSIEELKNAVNDSIYANDAGLITAEILQERLHDVVDTLNAIGASANHNHDERYYTETEVTAAIATAIANLVASAPATLDTFNELAVALGNDPNLSTTLITLIGTKASINNPTFTGTVAGITAAMVGALAASATAVAAAKLITTSFTIEEVAGVLVAKRNSDGVILANLSNVGYMKAKDEIEPRAAI